MQFHFALQIATFSKIKIHLKGIDQNIDNIEIDSWFLGFASFHAQTNNHGGKKRNKLNFNMHIDMQIERSPKILIVFVSFIEYDLNISQFS